MDERFDDFKSKPNQNKKRKVDYTCNQCEYVATQAGNLKAHKHEGVRYTCKQCSCAATTAITHVEIKHEGIIYPCSKCDYFATTASNLKFNDYFKNL